MIKHSSYGLCLIVFTLLTSCGNTQITKENLQASCSKDFSFEPADGTAVIRGQLINAYDIWPERQVSLYVAPFFSENNNNNGIYVLEPSLHPQVILDECGFFEVQGVPPGKHVIIFGPNPDEAEIFRHSLEIQIFETEANEILDVGEIQIN